MAEIWEVPRARAALQQFLHLQGFSEPNLGAPMGDASQRRYFRVNAGKQTAILMLDPPPNTSLARFQTVAGCLRSHGVRVPEIFATDLTEGFALLEDFGDTCFAQALDRGAPPPEGLFQLAVDLLIYIAHQVPVSALPISNTPHYDRTAFADQLNLLLDFPQARPAPPVSAAARRDFAEIVGRLLAPLAAWPIVVMHRDFFVDNLMLLNGADGTPECGLLDFQDAGVGPAGYDLISLLEDARRDVPATIRALQSERYWALFPALQPVEVNEITAVLAAVRHLRVIAVFNRLALVHGNRNYLHHLPRIKAYLERHLESPVLQPLKSWLDSILGCTWIQDQSNL